MAKKDALSTAHNHLASALNVFEDAKARLHEAVTHFHAVEAAEQGKIADAQARLKEATEARLRSSRVLERIHGLLD